MTPLKYMLAHILGSILGAAILATADAVVKASFDYLHFLMVLGMAPIFAVFGFFPSLVAGAPALRFLLSSNCRPFARLVFLVAGGTLVGALFASSLLTGAVGMGAIVGGATGLVQGLMFYWHRLPNNEHVAT